ncbi:IMP cyclohydrolase [Candidatus Bathyarchaeota archaeon]|nr:IMP cyclohydrolase [Candidatus Bathyarchaeota archaeon]
MKYALISVYDKTGIVDFARELVKLGFEIIATEGTFKTLTEAGIHRIIHVSDITEFPEMLGGRIKTEHPKLIGALLALRKNQEHMKELERLGIRPIDLVVCNLYPLYQTGINSTDVNNFLEQIDIGGPNMIRAAAKNFGSIAIIVNSNRYTQVVREYKKNGELSLKTKKKLAIEAFKVTARYDSKIYRLLESI